MNRSSLTLLVLLTLSAPASSKAASSDLDMEQTQSRFEKALAADPHDRDALFMLALIYEKKQQRRAALDFWKRYVDEETDPAKREIGQKHIHHLSQ